MKMIAWTPQLKKDVLEWDTVNWARALEFWEGNSKVDFQSCRALELGTGNGGVSLWLALHGARVTCTDYPEPSQAAKDLHRRYGVSNLITYQPADARALQCADPFDIIAFKSILGVVGRSGRKDYQATAVNNMYLALKPGGELLFAENLVGSRLHTLLRRRFVKWGTRWRYVAVEEMLEFLTLFPDVHYMSFGVLGTLGRNEFTGKILGIADLLVDRFSPPQWRYIIAGVARKERSRVNDIVGTLGET